MNIGSMEISDLEDLVIWAFLCFSRKKYVGIYYFYTSDLDKATNMILIFFFFNFLFFVW